jgi:drug/metabolite transporter (DMT)-like permease
MIGISQRLLGAASLTLSALLWAGNAVVGRAVRFDCDPLTLSYFRWLITAILIGTLGWRHIRRDVAIYKKHWKFVVSGGLLGMAFFHTLQYSALAKANATDVALIMSFTPIIVVMMTAALEWKQPRTRELLGLILSVAGAAAIVRHGSFGSLETHPRDSAVVVTALLCWAGYSVIVRDRPTNLSISSMVFGMSLTASVFLTPFYAISVFQEQNASFNWQQLLAIGYVSLFASLIAYQAYSLGIDKLGAIVAPQYLSLIPVFTGLLSAVFIGETPQFNELLAMALIVGGLLLATTPPLNTASKALPDEAGSRRGALR